MKKGKQELPIIEKTYDAIKWLIPKIERFPRSQKFVLGDRLEVAFLDFLKLITIASKTKEKIEILFLADAKLTEIRYLCRLVVDLRYLSLKQYEFLSGIIVELGSMLGGWIKYYENA
jgi:hypothetical protein